MENTAKNYLFANDYLHDAWRLAAQVKNSGWRPDVLIALWRGGAPVGVAVHEFLKVSGLSIRHLPLKCKSYAGIEDNSLGVTFECAEEVLASLKPGEKVLVVDDVFDTGTPAEAMVRRLAERNGEMRLACVYWKPTKNQTTLRPDFVVNEVLDRWIVFPHEIEGLTPDEIREKDPMLADLLER